MRHIKCASNIQDGSIDTTSVSISVAVLFEGTEALFVDFALGGEILRTEFRRLNRPASSITVNSKQRALAFGNAHGVELHRLFDVMTSKCHV